MTDLDKLEALAKRVWSAINDRRYPRFSDMESSAEAIDDLIASAREAAAEIERLRRIEAIANMLDRHLGEDDRMWSDDSTISTEWIGSDGVRRSLTFGLFRQLREALSARDRPNPQDERGRE